MKKGHLESFADHELLETILFNVVPRGDTNKIAHDLLLTFGNLKSILSANIFKLKSVKGVGSAVADYIQTLGELFRRSSVSEFKLLKLDNPIKIKDYIRNAFTFDSDERFIMICADKNLKVLQNITLSKGDSATTKISISEALKSAILANAKYVLFAHNHIDNSCNPSQNDIKSTKELVQKFAYNNIIVLDHVITNGKEEFNFRGTEYFYNWFSEIGVDIKKLFEQNLSKEFKMNAPTPSQEVLEMMFLNETKK